MFLASKVRMVCGDETADMHALKEIELVCSTLLMSYRPQSDYDYKDAQLKLLPLLNDADLFVNLPYDDGMSALSVLISQIHRKDQNGRLVPFGDTHGIVRMQSRISTLRCEDARDKVFAIINMFDESCKILPDYTVSEFDLALQVLDQYGRCDNDRKCVELAAYLCLNLRLRLNAPTGAKALLRNRNLASHYRGFLHGDKFLPLLRQSTPFASQVSRTTGGQMTAPFSYNKLLDPVLSVNKKILVVEQYPVAIASCEFAVGDWVAPLAHYTSDYYNIFCFSFVLRLKEAKIYDIMGEVAFYPNCAPCVSWEMCNCQFGNPFHPDHHTDFDITFDSEELLLFSTRLCEPFEVVKRESQSFGRSLPELPSGPPMKWISSYAKRRDSTSPLRMPFKPRNNKAEQGLGKKSIELRLG